MCYILRLCRYQAFCILYQPFKLRCLKPVYVFLDKYDCYIYFPNCCIYNLVITDKFILLYVICVVCTLQIAILCTFTKPNGFVVLVVLIPNCGVIHLIKACFQQPDVVFAFQIMVSYTYKWFFWNYPRCINLSNYGHIHPVRNLHTP